MIGAVNRFMGSRGMRKFTRNRMAMLSLGVIGLYLMVALIVFAGIINLDSTKQRVNYNKWPGFGLTPAREKVLDELKARVAQFESAHERAQKSPEPARIMGELDWAERKVVRTDAAGYAELIDAMGEAWENLDTLLIDYEDVSDYVYSLRSDRVIAQRELQDDSISDEERERLESKIEEIDGELAEEMPAYEEAAAPLPDAIKKLEAALLDLQPMPTGLEGVVYRLKTSLGADSQGRPIMWRALYSTKIAFQIGLVTAVACVLIGTLLGAAAAFFGGIADYVVMYIVTVLSSIPYLVLLAVLVAMFFGSIFDDTSKPGLALVPLYAAFMLTFWVGVCRVIRGEVFKIKELEYVQAATALGFNRMYILVRHVIPNTAHLMFIQFSLLFIGAIKSEVILSYLGLGVKGQPSWGIMIQQGAAEITNFFFWEVLTASVFMFGLVLAFNIVSDALQDAFDPKHVS